MNSVNLIGRLCADPELRYLQSGTAVTNFTLAIERQMTKEKKDEAKRKGGTTADFINIVVWGKSAENCANYLAKGRLVAVQGRIQSGSYTAKDGSKRYATDVVAQTVEFLEWGDTKKDNGNDNKADDYGGFEDFHPIGNDDIPF